MCWSFCWRTEDNDEESEYEESSEESEYEESDDEDVDTLVRIHLMEWEVKMYAANPHLYCIPRLRRDAEEQRYRKELVQRYGLASS